MSGCGKFVCILAFPEYQDSDSTQKKWKQFYCHSHSQVANCWLRSWRRKSSQEFWEISFRKFESKLMAFFCHICNNRLPTKGKRLRKFLKTLLQAKICRLDPWCKKPKLHTWIVMNFKIGICSRYWWHSWHIQPVRIQTKGKTSITLRNKSPLPTKGCQMRT